MLISQKKKQGGFSLLELMIVMCISAILVAMGAFTTKHLRDRALLAVLQSDISRVRQAAIRYQQDCGFFPPDVERGVDPGLVSEYGWQTGSHSPDWEAMTCDHWRGPYLREWPKNPWGGVYDWDNFHSQYAPYGIAGAGVYLSLKPSDWGGRNGMPDTDFEIMVEQMGLDRAMVKGTIAFWVGQTTPVTTPAD